MIQFNQGFVHLSYVLFVYNYLAPLCTHYPSLIRRPTILPSIRWQAGGLVYFIYKYILGVYYVLLLSIQIL